MSENHTTAASWMDAWLNVPRAPGGRLEIGRFADHFYFLGLPISWGPNFGQVVTHGPVFVPVGFVTDLASIPRIFWTAFPPDGDYAYAAIVHDYLYWSQDRPREEADLILKLAMQDFNLNEATVFTIFEAVTLFGGSAWDNNARLKSQGEKRVLKRWPDDPRIKWIDWKKLPGVFV